MIGCSIILLLNLPKTGLAKCSDSYIGDKRFLLKEWEGGSPEAEGVTQR
jgi:hypothetical protein